MRRFPGKIAIVLGAGGRDNMGQAIARRLAGEGATVVVAGRNRAELDRLAGEIGGVGAICDTGSKAEIDALAAFALDRFGRIDIAVDCVGIQVSAPFVETTEDDLARLYAIQFKGPFQFLQAMVGAMGKGGSIVQISSAVGTILFDNHAAYGGTKAAIDQVVRAVADEFGARGIRVNSVSPGAVRTPMTAAALDMPGVEAVFAATSPLNRLGTVDEIAAAVAWLASDECFMTGENLQVSGGLLRRRNPTGREVADAIAHG